MEDFLLIISFLVPCTMAVGWSDCLSVSLSSAFCKHFGPKGTQLINITRDSTASPIHTALIFSTYVRQNLGVFSLHSVCNTV